VKNSLIGSKKFSQTFGLFLIYFMLRKILKLGLINEKISLLKNRNIYLIWVFNNNRLWFYNIGKRKKGLVGKNIQEKAI
jgi:hypothetical protein